MIRTNKAPPDKDSSSTSPEDDQATEQDHPSSASPTPTTTTTTTTTTTDVTITPPRQNEILDLNQLGDDPLASGLVNPPLSRFVNSSLPDMAYANPSLSPSSSACVVNSSQSPSVLNPSQLPSSVLNPSQSPSSSVLNPLQSPPQSSIDSSTCHDSKVSPKTTAGAAAIESSNIETKLTVSDFVKSLIKYTQRPRGSCTLKDLIDASQKKDGRSECGRNESLETDGNESREQQPHASVSDSAICGDNDENPGLMPQNDTNDQTESITNVRGISQVDGHAQIESGTNPTGFPTDVCAQTESNVNQRGIDLNEGLLHASSSTFPPSLPSLYQGGKGSKRVVQISDLRGSSACISLTRASKRYMAGEIVTGTIKLSVGERVLCWNLGIERYAMCQTKPHLYQIYDPDDAVRRDDTEHSFPFHIEVIHLWPPENFLNSRYIEADEYEFPFSFRLSEESPHSHRDDRMAIRHDICLQVTRTRLSRPNSQVLDTIDVIAKPVFNTLLHKTINIESELSNPNRESCLKFNVEINKPVISSIDGQFDVTIRAYEVLDDVPKHIKIFPVLVQRIKIPGQRLILQRVMVDFYKRVDYAMMVGSKPYKRSFQFKMPDVLPSTPHDRDDDTGDNLIVLYLLMVQVWKEEDETPTILMKRHIDVIYPLRMGHLFASCQHNSVKTNSLQILKESQSSNATANLSDQTFSSNTRNSDLKATKVISQEADSTVDGEHAPEPLHDHDSVNPVREQMGQRDEMRYGTVHSDLETNPVTQQGHSLLSSNITEECSKDSSHQQDMLSQPAIDTSYNITERGDSVERNNSASSQYAQQHDASSLTAPIWIGSNMIQEDDSSPEICSFTCGEKEASVQVILPKKQETTTEGLSFFFEDTGDDDSPWENDHLYSLARRIENVSFESAVRQNIAGQKSKPNTNKMTGAPNTSLEDSSASYPLSVVSDDQPCRIHQDSDTYTGKNKTFVDNIGKKYEDNNFNSSTCVRIARKKIKDENVHVCPLQKVSRKYGGEKVTILTDNKVVPVQSSSSCSMLASQLVIPFSPVTEQSNAPCSIITEQNEVSSPMVIRQAEVPFSVETGRTEVPHPIVAPQGNATSFSMVTAQSEVPSSIVTLPLGTSYTVVTTDTETPFSIAPVQLNIPFSIVTTQNDVIYSVASAQSDAPYSLLTGQTEVTYPLLTGQTEVTYPLVTGQTEVAHPLVTGQIQVPYSLVTGQSEVQYALVTDHSDARFPITPTSSDTPCSVVISQPEIPYTIITEQLGNSYSIVTSQPGIPYSIVTPQPGITISLVTPAENPCFTVIAQSDTPCLTVDAQPGTICSSVSAQLGETSSRSEALLGDSSPIHEAQLDDTSTPEPHLDDTPTPEAQLGDTSTPEAQIGDTSTQEAQLGDTPTPEAQLGDTSSTQEAQSDTPSYTTPPTDSAWKQLFDKAMSKADNTTRNKHPDPFHPENLLPGLENYKVCEIRVRDLLKKDFCVEKVTLRNEEPKAKSTPGSETHNTKGLKTQSTQEMTTQRNTKEEERQNEACELEAERTTQEMNAQREGHDFNRHQDALHIKTPTGATKKAKGVTSLLTDKHGREENKASKRTTQDTKEDTFQGATSTDQLDVYLEDVAHDDRGRNIGDIRSNLMKRLRLRGGNSWENLWVNVFNQIAVQDNIRLQGRKADTLALLSAVQNRMESVELLNTIDTGSNAEGKVLPDEIESRKKEISYDCVEAGGTQRNSELHTTKTENMNIGSSGIQEGNGENIDGAEGLEMAVCPNNTEEVISEVNQAEKVDDEQSYANQIDCIKQERKESAHDEASHSDQSKRIHQEILSQDEQTAKLLRLSESHAKESQGPEIGPETPTKVSERTRIGPETHKEESGRTETETEAPTKQSEERRQRSDTRDDQGENIEPATLSPRSENINRQDSLSPSNSNERSQGATALTPEATEYPGRQRGKENKTPSPDSSSSTEGKISKPKKPKISDRFCKPPATFRKRRSSDNDKDPPNNPKSVMGNVSSTVKSTCAFSTTSKSDSQGGGQTTGDISGGKVKSLSSQTNIRQMGKKAEENKANKTETTSKSGQTKGNVLTQINSILFKRSQNNKKETSLKYGQSKTNIITEINSILSGRVQANNIDSSLKCGQVPTELSSKYEETKTSRMGMNYTSGEKEAKNAESLLSERIRADYDTKSIKRGEVAANKIAMSYKEPTTKQNEMERNFKSEFKTDTSKSGYTKANILTEINSILSGCQVKNTKNSLKSGQTKANILTEINSILSGRAKAKNSENSPEQVVPSNEIELRSKWEETKASKTKINSILSGGSQAKNIENSPEHEQVPSRETKLKLGCEETEASETKINSILSKQPQEKNNENNPEKVPSNDTELASETKMNYKPGETTANKKETISSKYEHRNANNIITEINSILSDRAEANNAKTRHRYDGHLSKNKTIMNSKDLPIKACEIEIGFSDMDSQYSISGESSQGNPEMLSIFSGDSQEETDMLSIFSGDSQEEIEMLSFSSEPPPENTSDAVLISGYSQDNEFNKYSIGGESQANDTDIFIFSISKQSGANETEMCPIFEDYDINFPKLERLNQHDKVWRMPLYLKCYSNFNEHDLLDLKKRFDELTSCDEKPAHQHTSSWPDTTSLPQVDIFSVENDIRHLPSDVVDRRYIKEIYENWTFDESSDLTAFNHSQQYLSAYSELCQRNKLTANERSLNNTNTRDLLLRHREQRLMLDLEKIERDVDSPSSCDTNLAGLHHDMPPFSGSRPHSNITSISNQIVSNKNEDQYKTSCDVEYANRKKYEQKLLFEGSTHDGKSALSIISSVPDKSNTDSIYYADLDWSDDDKSSLLYNLDDKRQAKIASQQNGTNDNRYTISPETVLLHCPIAKEQRNEQCQSQLQLSITTNLTSYNNKNTKGSMRESFLENAYQQNITIDRRHSTPHETAVPDFSTYLNHRNEKENDQFPSQLTYCTPLSQVQGNLTSRKENDQFPSQLKYCTPLSQVQSSLTNALADCLGSGMKSFTTVPYQRCNTEDNKRHTLHYNFPTENDKSSFQFCNPSTNLQSNQVNVGDDCQDSGYGSYETHQKISPVTDEQTGRSIVGKIIVPSNKKAEAKQDVLFTDPCDSKHIVVSEGREPVSCSNSNNCISRPQPSSEDVRKTSHLQHAPSKTAKSNGGINEKEKINKVSEKRGIKSRIMEDTEEYESFRAKKYWYTKMIKEIETELLTYTWRDEKYERLKQLQEEVDFINEKLERMGGIGHSQKYQNQDHPLRFQDISMNAKSFAPLMKDPTMQRFDRDYMDARKYTTKHSHDVASWQNVAFNNFNRRSRLSSIEKHMQANMRIVQFMNKNKMFPLQQPMQRTYRK